MKLNQAIAISNGEKSRKQKVLSKIYQNLGKEVLFEGISKKYTPKDEEGENLPEEKKYVQITVEKAIEDAVQVMKDMFNIVATQDIGNCDAVADIKIENNTIVEDVPVTHLLFLEKQLEDINTFVAALPTLDPAEKWEYSDETACYKSEPKDTVRTKKVPKNHVLAQATDKHPAQVQVFTEDIVVGTWRTIKFSGNMTQTEKDAILERIRRLAKAVKFAREEANSIEVSKSNIGDKILNYIFE